MMGSSQEMRENGSKCEGAEEMTQVNELRYTEITQSRCTVVQRTHVQFPAHMADASKLPVTLAP